MLPMSPWAGLLMPLTSSNSLEWPKSTLTRQALHHRLILLHSCSSAGFQSLPVAAGASGGRSSTTVAWTNCSVRMAATACQLQQALLPGWCWMLEDRQRAVQVLTDIPSDFSQQHGTMLA